MRVKQEIEQIINHFNLQPHPEGGFYVETYRSDLEVNFNDKSRSASSAILFLITKDSISHFHKLTADEGWHFYSGSPLIVTEVTPQGQLIETIMGGDFLANQKIQYIVKAGNWFSSRSIGDYSFVGCTVSPAFEFRDFEMAKKSNLLNEFGDLSEIIEKYCLD